MENVKVSFLDLTVDSDITNDKTHANKIFELL